MSNRVQKLDESCSKTKIIKTAWSTKEDNLIKKVIRMCGMNWIAIALHVPNKNPNQCAQNGNDFKEEGVELINFGNRKKTNSCYGSFHNSEGSRRKQLRQSQISLEYIESITQLYLIDLIYQLNYQISVNQLYLKIRYQFYFTLKISYRSDNQIKNRFYNNIRSQYLQIQNPYYSKQTLSQPKKLLEKVREEHLRINGTYNQEKIIEDQNDTQTKEEDLSKYINQQNDSNIDLEYYSNMDLEHLRMSQDNIL